MVGYAAPGEHESFQSGPWLEVQELIQSQINELIIASAKNKVDIMWVEFWGICSANLQIILVSRFCKSHAGGV